ncbi:DUF4199 domain-containing protein [Hufsiella ginkgonis]|uniref:DUF4199 family protein n=1 Tax=Hufsiella ginkgonis TaxID=2695274 RepID=A0A7K1XVM2_9SPHI|nr:DUF4199 domain-containing protein [Hufsiella ginkgonis]MXV15030.1 DUF4199 family protein [Hufsiella ginkgonis]
MEDINKEIRKNALSNGVIIGIIILVMSIVLLYLMSSWVSMMALAVSGGLTFVVYILCAIFFSIDLRKKVGGFWSFRQAVSGIFIMFLVATIVSTIGNYIFTQFIEKDLTVKMVENIKTATSNFMSNQGVDQATIDQKMSEMDVDMAGKLHPTAMDYVKNLLTSVIVMFICALIFAAIFKKERPIVISDDES